MTTFSKQQPTWRDVLLTNFRLLTFRATHDELASLTYRHLAVGLLCAWIVGIGRYYDNLRAGFWQHLGVGSVIYVVVFGTFLWLVIWPLKPPHWSWIRVCTFVSLVSPPAIIYAIPVERFFDLDTANSVNVWFLGIVALWRVALLIYFLRVLTRMDVFSILVTTLLPLSVIVTTLTMLNLERAVFSIMGGLHERTANDAAFGLLFLISFVSMLLFIPLALCYVVLIAAGIAERRRLKAT